MFWWGFLAGAALAGIPLLVFIGYWMLQLSHMFDSW